jgi:hypothetical protein
MSLDVTLVYLGIRAVFWVVRFLVSFKSDHLFYQYPPFALFIRPAECRLLRLDVPALAVSKTLCLQLVPAVTRAEKDQA